MRRTTFSGLFTALALTAVVATAGAGSAEPEDPAGPLLSTTEQAAVEVLDEVTATLADATQSEITTSLVQLQQVYDDLPAAERTEAKALFARPDDSAIDPQHDLIGYGSVAPFTTCNTRICVHWTETGKHKVTGTDPAATDNNAATVPTWVTTTLAVVEESWTQQVSTLGYRRPTPDGTRGNPGGNPTAGLLDVYLGQLGPNYYGYANWDPDANKGGYLVLDNDFAEFSLSPINSLRATAAHEFFHVVQFAYQRKADPWLMESTATWMEEVVFDSVNDNRQYLRFSSLKQPSQPLDVGGLAQYGNWIFFEYLANKHGTDVVRSIWYRMTSGKRHAAKAIDSALKAQGSSLADAFADFSARNLNPGKTYAEGANYPKPRINSRRSLSPSRRTSGPITATLDHLTSKSQPFRASGSLGRKWRLRINVTAPNQNLRARVVVHRTDGRVSVRTLPLRRGTGQLGIAFGTKDVKRVTVTVANGSGRYDCKRRTDFTCNGLPKDDNAKVTVQARLVKRS